MALEYLPPHISKCTSFSTDVRSSLTHSGGAGGQTYTRGISVSTQYLPIRIPWLKNSLESPLLPTERLAGLNMIVVSLGQNQGRVSRVMRGLECCREHEQRECEGAPALRILHAACGVPEPFRPQCVEEVTLLKKF